MNQAAGHLANLSIRRFLADTAIGLVLVLITVREVGAGIKLSDISATTLVALLIVAQVAGLLVNAFSYVLLGRHVADATRLIGRHRWWAVHTKHVFRYAETRDFFGLGEGTQASYSQLSYLAEQSDVLKPAGFETGYIHGLTQLCRNTALVVLLWPLVLLREQSLNLFMLLFAVLALWSICRVVLDLKSDSPLLQIVATFLAASALWGIGSWCLNGAIGWATPVLALAAGACQATLLIFAGYLRFYEHAGAAFHARRLFHSHVVASSVVGPVPRVATIEGTGTPSEATGQMLAWRNVLQGSEPTPYGETDEEGWKRIDLVLARVRESLRGAGAQKS